MDDIIDEINTKKIQKKTNEEKEKHATDDTNSSGKLIEDEKMLTTDVSIKS